MAELVFIGTGSGKVSLNRFHSSFLILTSRYNLLIDAGDGISKALLTGEINFSSIDGILITHLHPDHYTGLAALIVQMKMCERKKHLDIIINTELVNVIQKFILNSYLFPERMGFAIHYKSIINDELFNVNNEISFIPRQNSHLVPVSGLEKYKLQSFSCSSFLLNIENIKIHYTGDIGSKDDLLLFSDYTIDYLISEVTHIQPNDILNSYPNDALPPKIILTHITDEDINNLKELIVNLQVDLKEKFILAFDGLKITL